METLVELKNVFKKYDKYVLKNINFKVNRGEKIAIVGANGGGKSTMSEIITGIRKPTKGKVIKKDDFVIGIQFQQSKYPLGITVTDMIKYYLKTFNIPMNYAELEVLLETYQLSQFSKKFVADLSIGDQQRLNILLAIIHKPDLVLLDEISTGLDIKIREDIFKFLEKNLINSKTTVLLITHHMEEVERFCDRLIFLHQGEIIEQITVKEIINKYGNTKTYMEFMLNKYKSHDLEQKNKIVSLPSSTSFINHKRDKPQKIWSLWKLISKFYGRGIFVPLLLILYPILSLLFMGYAYQTIDLYSLKQIIQANTIVQIISVGMFIIPETVIDFKNSVILKRIGATKIKSTVFSFSLVLLGFIFSLFSYFWSILWAGIFYGSTYGINNLLQLNNLFQALPFLLIFLFCSSGFGLMLTIFFKSPASFIAASNFFFIIISFLSGAYVPFSSLMQDNILKFLLYFNPFYYIIHLYLNAIFGTFVFDLQNNIFIFVSLIFLISFIYFGAKKLTWQI